MEQNNYRISQICSIKSGKRLPAGTDFSLEPTKYKYIRARDIKTGKIILDDVAYIDEETKQKINKYIINKGDIAITIVANIGDIGYADLKCDGINLTENAVRLTNFDKDIVNSKYLSYYLSQPIMKTYMENLAAGAAQAKLGIYKIEKIKVQLPSISIQNSIVNVIEKYDSLIELNTKRIKTLEQMAENLYKEWFVRFHFPGHEKAEFENGIPKGWEIKRIGEIGKVVGGGTPSTEQSEYWNGDIPWLTPADMKSFDDIYISSGSTFITEEGLKKSSATMLPKDTVLLSSRAPIGYVGIAKNPICTNQGFKNVICNPTNILPEVLFYFFKKNKDLLECYASGSTFLEVSSGRLKKIKLIVPPLNIQQIFVDTISPWIKQTDALSEINNNLIKQRDLLLPRLMSGKLEV